MYYRIPGNLRHVWNVLAEERGAQEQRKCSCKVT